MKTFRLNTLIISLSLIAVIGIMGVGYAQWKDDIHLFGKVSTGYASISLDHPNTYARIPMSMVVTEPGQVRSEFVITNTGTVPMKLESKSDNIDFVCDELISGVSATGYIVTEIGNKRHGSYIEDLTGIVRMVALNDSWSQDIDITASICVNIKKPAKSKKKDVVKPIPQPVIPAPKNAAIEPISPHEEKTSESESESNETILPVDTTPVSAEPVNEPTAPPNHTIVQPTIPSEEPSSEITIPDSSENATEEPTIQLDDVLESTTNTIDD